MAVRLLPITSLASHAAEWRTPRNRPPPARRCASSTGSTRSPRVRSAKPTMPAATRVAPYVPLSLIAAIPATNSVSPTGRMASGPRRAVHGVAFQEHGGDDVVAGAKVGEQLVEQVAMAASLPQVMMGVDDGQVGIENVLAAAPAPARLRREERSGRTRVTPSPDARDPRSGRGAAAPRPPSPAAD